MTATLDAQRTQPDRRAVRRPGCPGAGVPPDPPPETGHRERRRTPCSACSPAATDIGELLARAARRDPRAWEEILRRYSGLVWARVRSLRLQEADAVDAVQLTWLRLAENCDRIEHPDRLGGWLTTTAYRECLRILRPTRQTAQPVDGLADTLTDPAAGPERTVLDTETAEEVRAVVAELPARSRTLIQAMFADETRPYAEISRHTGIPVGSLGPTRARALQQLRRMLAERGLERPA
jgi:RNA polymerase sigma factor (sigma-70 family)